MWLSSQARVSVIQSTACTTFPSFPIVKQLTIDWAWLGYIELSISVYGALTLMEERILTPLCVDDLPWNGND